MHPLRSTPSLVCLSAVILVSATATPAGGPAPYDVAVRVIWGDESMGPESLRERVEWQVVQSLDSSGCYRSLYPLQPKESVESAEEANPDLVLRIELSDLEVREDWELSVADRTARHVPEEETDDDRTATVAFDARYELALWPEERVVRHKTLRHSATYRPHRGEDPREAVRDQAIAALGRSVRSFVCKRRGKLPREIEQARSGGD